MNIKLSVVGYNAFKDVIDDFGGSPTHVFYCQTGANVFKALATMSSGEMIEGNLSFSGQSVTNFTTEYPGAVETPFDIKGEI